METRYAIDCTRNSDARIRSYVIRPNLADTFTQHIDEAQLWKTRAGAERWLAARNITAWQIVEVTMRKSVRGGLVPRLAQMVA